MSANYKEHMLSQAFIELDIQITSLAQRLNANRYIEIGDDPNLVQDIEDTLLQAHSNAKLIGPYFDLKVTPLSKANIYFALIKRINDTLKYLQGIRKKNYGSRQHTRELLEKLKDCTKSIYAVEDLVNTNKGIIH